MTLFKRIIWALLEVATIGSGTYMFVSTMVDDLGVDKNDAGLGAFLIILGLLLRNWRMTLFIKSEGNESSTVQKSEIQSKSVNTLLIIAISFSMFMLNKKINDTNTTMDSSESQIQTLDSRVSELDDIEYRLDKVESLKERIDELETYSHSHY